MKRSLNYFSLLILLVGISPLIFGQPFGPGERGFEGFGPGGADGSRLIKKLNRALEASGADLLSTGENGQEEQIAALLEEMRANRPTPDQENPNRGLMKEYAAEILSENPDIAKIEEIADLVATAMADRTAKHMLARANFQIALLGILTDDQIEALQAQFGEQGILRLLNARGGRVGKFSNRGGHQGGREGFSPQRGRGPARGGISGP